jgi:3-hydroxyacyl-[acyl-carrier-protein] dehydratase
MTEPANSAEVRQRVKDILRRDLKMGNDVRIDDQMPLFNSDADLDSLDMLLLVSSIEREFGFRIPNEAVGQTVFQNVDSLASYIEQNRGQTSASRVRIIAPGLMPLDRLPHGEPFRFVTKVNQFKTGESIEGIWSVVGSEPFFAGHFPGRPIVPGVLLAEALAQISGLIEDSGVPRQGMLAHVDVRFEKPVVPPADIILKSRLVQSLGELRQFQVSATVGNETIAHGTLALHLSPRGVG